MLELENLTYREFLESENRDEYLFASKYAKQYTDAIDIYGVGNIYEQPFGFVKDVQFDLETNQLSWDNLINFICQVSKKDIKEIYNESFLRVCQFRMYLINNIQALLDAEKKLLTSEASEDEQQAGLGLFENLGIFIQTDSLAGGDVLKHSEVRALPYSKCLTKLALNKQLKDYQDNMNRIINNKHS